MTPDSSDSRLPKTGPLHIETLAVHAGHTVDAGTRAVAPPIVLSTTFERGADGGYPAGFVYGRAANPNRASLEIALALLEGGAAAAAFSSGSAATSAVVQALRPGDHVVAPMDAYYGTGKILREVMEPWGLSASFVDMTDTAAVRAACTPRTRLIWMETPSNPQLTITDIRAMVAIAREVGALAACDNTWATPVFQRPIELGVDLVMHSSTKYFGGHGDVLGGALIAREDNELFQRIRLIQTTTGSVPSPFDCWLVLRGLRTLPYRMRGHAVNARRVAEWLSMRNGVTAVHYPGLSSHPGHAVSRAQMKDAGGMLAFEVGGGQDAALRVASSTKLFTQATSLGSTESLIEHRASVEGPTTRAPAGLLRVSVGLEHPDDLIADLDQAIGVIE